MIAIAGNGKLSEVADSINGQRHILGWHILVVWLFHSHQVAEVLFDSDLDGLQVGLAGGPLGARGELD